jgi:hypothetical protein
MYLLAPRLKMIMRCLRAKLCKAGLHVSPKQLPSALAVYDSIWINFLMQFFQRSGKNEMAIQTKSFFFKTLGPLDLL